jgi:hypothetical protein
MIEESGSGSITMINGSGFMMPKSVRIRIRIRICNTALKSSALLTMTRHAGNKLRGLGGEVMRQAVSEYIANCARARLPVTRSVVASWRQVIDDSLRWE